MISHLFVYGTLKSTAKTKLGQDMRVRLQMEGRLLGAATIQARMYDLGAYPALTLSDTSADIVHGEVYELVNPATALLWLDDYEGIGRGQSAVDEYERVERHVRLHTGIELSAWVYVYRGVIKGLPRVASGRWQANTGSPKRP